MDENNKNGFTVSKDYAKGESEYMRQFIAFADYQTGEIENSKKGFLIIAVDGDAKGVRRQGCDSLSFTRLEGDKETLLLTIAQLFICKSGVCKFLMKAIKLAFATIVARKVNNNQITKKMKTITKNEKSGPTPQECEEITQLSLDLSKKIEKYSFIVALMALQNVFSAVLWTYVSLGVPLGMAKQICEEFSRATIADLDEDFPMGGRPENFDA